MSYATWLCAPALAIGVIGIAAAAWMGQWAAAALFGFWLLCIGSLCWALNRLGY